LEKFVPPLNFARQYVRNMGINVGAFLRQDFHLSAGMYDLIESFYRSISDARPVPIPYSEILLTAHIMDAIFEQLAAQRVKT
jgi:hypothetical protein